MLKSTSEPSAAAAPDRDEIDDIKAAIIAKLTLSVGKDAKHATDRDWFMAAALVARDRIVPHFLEAERNSTAAGSKRVYYLSLEFLIGRLFNDVLSNIGLTDAFRVALGDLGVDVSSIRDEEPDAALGNGGLGRLAACFMESMATLAIPACGYGIRYDHGLFRQVIKDGWQEEFPETWLSFGNPWEFERPEVSYEVCFGGWVETSRTQTGLLRFTWHPAERVQAVAYDTPIVGWGGEHVNPLRLWSARAADPMRLDVFNRGDHIGAQSEQARAEAISKILYPSDETPAGQELRLRQEYFFVSASLQDLVKRHLATNGSLMTLGEHASIQLNDTHPAIAIPELMRLLIDIHNFTWDEAWAVTQKTFSYTNHTLLPEALESWSVPLFERVLPRHLQIIYFINALHLEKAREKFSDDPELMRSISLIEERGERRLRMGHLAFVGSHAINGVSGLHSDLMRETVFHDLDTVLPGRIQNKTNGITFRRWFRQANPALVSLASEVCGDVMEDPTRLVRLADHAGDAALRERLTRIKHTNKIMLARLIRDRTGITVDPSALFDVQIKRIHEYKRQLLNLIETVALYDAIRSDPNGDWVPRVKIFAGKAAASYVSAKLIIKLAHDVARTINGDPSVRDLLKVVFMPNYNVSLAEAIIPAADLSEQISTAGMEASGTGNMKLALNGALTIGTLDGANVEIREHVGDDNIFIFGLKAHEVVKRKENGPSAAEMIANSPKLAQMLGAIGNGVFSHDDPDRFAPLVDSLRGEDRYMLTHDFDDYYATQRRVDALWSDSKAWQRAAIANIAHMAWFSSDRTISEYAREIWNVEPGGPLARVAREA